MAQRNIPINMAADVSLMNDSQTEMASYQTVNNHLLLWYS